MFDAIIAGPREEPNRPWRLRAGPAEEIEDQPDVIDADIEIDAVEIEDAEIRVEATVEDLMNPDPRPITPDESVSPVNERLSPSGPPGRGLMTLDRAVGEAADMHGRFDNDMLDSWATTATKRSWRSPTTSG